jgi:hypothetical protein
MAWNAAQSALLMQTCLNHTYTSDGTAYRVQTRVARFAVPACPASLGALSCQEIVEVEGIRITVSGRLAAEDFVLADLSYTLKKRGGKFLGFDAVLDDQTDAAR